MRPVDGEVYRLEQRGLERRVAEQAERIARHRAVVPGAFEGIGDRIVALDQALRLRQILGPLLEILQGALPERAVDGATS